MSGKRTTERLRLCGPSSTAIDAHDEGIFIIVAALVAMRDSRRTDSDRHASMKRAAALPQLPSLARPSCAWPPHAGRMGAGLGPGTGTEPGPWADHLPAGTRRVWRSAYRIDLELANALGGL